MKELALIYDKATGDIVFQGKVDKIRDQEWIDNGDTTTMLGFIQNYLLENLSCTVVYKPYQKGITPETQKMNTSTENVINKTAGDLAADKKKENIINKQAEVARLEKIVNASTDLTKAQSELAILEAS